MAIECVLHGTVSLGDSTVVLGRVVHLAIDEAVIEDGHPEIGRLRPLSRLGRNEWGTVGEVKRIDRVKWRDGRLTSATSSSTPVRRAC